MYTQLCLAVFLYLYTILDSKPRNSAMYSLAGFSHTIRHRQFPTDMLLANMV